MKESYQKIALLLLVIVVAFQGYFLYDINRTIKGNPVSLKNWELSVFPEIVPFIGFNDTKEDPFLEMEKRLMNLENIFQTIPSLNKLYSRFYSTSTFDMKEQDGEYIITMELPGLDKDSISIKIEDGQLIVTASVAKEKSNDTTIYYQRERRVSSYKNVVLLPKDTNEESLQSEYKDGLLTITFEKIIP